jgi:hypothetical protein
LFFFASQAKDISIRATHSTIYGGRLEILLGYLEELDNLSLLIGKYIGYGSNVVQLLTEKNGFDVNGSNVFLADSTWTSLLSQFGILGIFIVIQVIYFLWKNPRGMKNITFGREVHIINTNFVNERAGLVIYLICCTSTAIIFESYAVLPIVVCLMFALRTQTLALQLASGKRITDDCFQFFNTSMVSKYF